MFLRSIGEVDRALDTQLRCLHIIVQLTDIHATIAEEGHQPTQNSHGSHSHASISLKHAKAALQANHKFNADSLHALTAQVLGGTSPYLQAHPHRQAGKGLKRGQNEGDEGGQSPLQAPLAQLLMGLGDTLIHQQVRVIYMCIFYVLCYAM